MTSDARWLDVADDVAEATDHFVKAHALYETGRFDDQSLSGYRDRMALMHALQSAHTSAEKALLRLLSILGEEKPTGDDWHQTLISRLAKAIDGDRERPAVLSPEVASDLDETRRFRNSVTHSYGTFDVARSAPSLQAAKRLATTFPSDVERFREAIDPQP